MAAFKAHNKCAYCGDNKLGQDPFVLGKLYEICDGLIDSQKETLSMPCYKIRKERKTGNLVSPEDVTLITSVDDISTINQASAQPSAQPHAFSSQAQPVSYNCSEL